MSVLQSPLGENMEPQQFYDNLRPEDQHNVKFAVDQLKAQGFEVYATGSSLKRKDYHDVDIVAKPAEGMTRNDINASLDAIVTELEHIGGRDATLSPFVQDIILDGSRYVGSDYTERRQVNFKNPANVLQASTGPQTYSGSLVAEQMFIEQGGTKIDIVISYDPFGTHPDTDNVQL